MFASAVDSEEDTTQFMTPITLIIVFAFFAGFYSVSNPDGPLALLGICHSIQLTHRDDGAHTFWNSVVGKLLSLGLLYGTFLLIAVFAAKIYRVGILMYGKKPSWKEMMKWIKYK